MLRNNWGEWVKLLTPFFYHMKKRKKSKEWTEIEISLLGTMSDPKLAKILNRPVKVVYRKRRSMEIDSSRPANITWTPEMISQIGTEGDYVIARRLGLNTYAVRPKREELGIPPFIPAKKDINWTDDKLALLGTDTDEEIAKVINASTYRVRQKRKSLGITAARFCGVPNVHTNRPWEPDEEKLLGTDFDEVIARKINRSAIAVGLRRRLAGIPSVRRDCETSDLYKVRKHTNA
jgi:hypothetical protein